MVDLESSEFPRIAMDTQHIYVKQATPQAEKELT